MGKILGFLIMFLFIDILFIATGQLCSTDVCSLSSIMVGTITGFFQNPGDISTLQFVKELIGDLSNGVQQAFSSGAGIASLFGTGAVIIGAFFATREFNILFIPMALTLALLASDIIIITSTLFGYNVLLGVLIGVPIFIGYMFSVIEWLRGKD